MVRSRRAGDLTWSLRILLVIQTDDVSFAVLGLDLLARRFRVLGPYADAFAGLIANPNDAYIELLPVAFASRLFHRIIGGVRRPKASGSAC